MNKTIQIVIESHDLSSRKTAADKRDEVLRLVEQGVVVLDLSAVESISDSYADELFGVLAAVYGLNWFSSHLRIVGAKEPILKDIAVAVKRRLAEPQAA